MLDAFSGYAAVIGGDDDDSGSDNEEYYNLLINEAEAQFLQEWYAYESEMRGRGSGPRGGNTSTTTTSTTTTTTTTPTVTIATPRFIPKPRQQEQGPFDRRKLETQRSREQSIKAKLGGRDPATLDKKEIFHILYKHVVTDKDIDLRGDGNQCSICQEDFKLGESVKRLMCFHPLHTKCFHEFFQSDWFFCLNCPLCRSDCIEELAKLR